MLVAAVGSGLLIFDDLFSPTFALYPIVAVVFALGLGVLILAAWRAHTMPCRITLIWLAAIVIGAGLVLFAASGRAFPDASS